jgi:hypothetical protein
MRAAYWTFARGLGSPSVALLGKRNKDGSERAKHGRAAYAREDVEDSKRGRPAVDLSAAAAARGLRFRGPIRMGAFMSATPIWPDYVFNAMDGRLPRGRYGLFEHELDEVPVGQDGIDEAGSFYGVRSTYRSRESVGSFLTYGLLGSEKAEPNEPFAANAVWIPASSVAVRAPETNVLGSFDIRRKGNLPRWGVQDLGELGLPGFRGAGTDSPEVDRDVLAEALAGRAGDALRECAYPYLRLEVGFGVVSLRRNGFAPEPEIDELIERAERIAEGLTAACGKLLRPQSLDAPLPPPAGPDPGLSKKQRQLAEIMDGNASGAAERIAGELGMEVEDPRAYHRAFPEVPMPGRARIVLRGSLPGTSAPARLLYTGQGSRAGMTLRGGVLLPAAADPPELPLGGDVVEETGMYGEVVGGIAAIWDRRRVNGRLEAADLAQRALRTAAELKIAAV